MWWFFRAFSSLITLSLIVLTIPLAFDVGGRECGLAFSLSLAIFYFIYSFLRLITPPDSVVRKSLANLIGLSSWLSIAVLLIWSLAKFSVDSDGSSAGWVGRAFGQKAPVDASLKEMIFGRGGLLERMTIGSWDRLLRWSTPVFQIAEGFCSLLVIQACGQISRWLVNQEYGDSAMVCLLLSLNCVHLQSADRSAWCIRRHFLKRALLRLQDSLLPRD